jgi:pimeloyl-ACP methyl ester carboxylesterase
MAFVRPWGFDVAEITVPVTVWQGAQDRMVPFAHGQWLAANVAGAEAHLLEDEGHLSLILGSFHEILDDLMAVSEV